MFRVFLFNDLSKENVGKLEKYIKLCINTLKNYAPNKNRYTRGNPISFINKPIMNRARLRNVYLRKRSDEKRKKYSKQRNYCVLSLRRTKRKKKALQITRNFGELSNRFSQKNLRLMQRQH